MIDLTPGNWSSCEGPSVESRQTPAAVEFQKFGFRTIATAIALHFGWGGGAMAP